MSKETPKSIVRTFVEILQRLPARRRKQFWLIFGVVLCVAVLEPVALSSLAAFASAVTDPGAVIQSKYVTFARSTFHLNFLNSPRGIITSMGVIVLALAMLKSAGDAFVTFAISRFSTVVEGFWGEKLLYGLLKMPYEWHSSYNSADLIQAVQWRLYLGRHFINPCISILSDSLMITLILITLLLFQPVLSLALLVIFGGLAFLIYTKVRKHLDRAAELCQQYDLSLARKITRAVHGVKDIKIANKESTFVEYFNEDVYPLSRAYGAAQFFTKLPTLLLETIGLVTIVVTICLMLFLMNYSIAEITGFSALLIIAFWRLMPTVNRMVGGIAGFGNVMPYVYHELSLLDIVEANLQEIAARANSDKSDFHFKSSIQLEGVSFSYKSRSEHVLEDINVQIKKGQTVGVIGSSGSGKSTLINIIIGLLATSKGRVLIDGKVLDESLLASWLKKVGYVPQFPYIYDGSLAENVAFSLKASDIDRARVQECCEMAGLQDFLRSVPSGIDTQIGERGVLLSGGQQQRIAIARSLYHGPEIVVFDEATSALDMESERAIQSTIYSLKGRWTLIVIAHRLTSVKDCDYLIWIDQGKIRMIDVPDKVLPRYEEAGDGELSQMSISH